MSARIVHFPSPTPWTTKIAKTAKCDAFVAILAEALIRRDRGPAIKEYFEGLGRVGFHLVCKRAVEDVKSDWPSAVDAARRFGLMPREDS